KSFAGLNFSFDIFSGTSKPIHHKLSQQFFSNLLENDFITTKSNEQFYCEDCNRYLADRYVEGTCPSCKSVNARGDQCDDCGKLIETTKLIDPKCKMCGNTPIIKNTKHWFLELQKFEKALTKWLEKKEYWKPNVINFIRNWIESGLHERAVTRDLDWGVPLPIENTEGKVLYVWLDAPIGYISATKEYSIKVGKPNLWKDYWQNDQANVVHFIGKDNIPFHTIIWPATLMGQKENWNLPENVPANEYLNLEGKQLSTSRNWAIWVNDFLEDFDSDYLRYILAVNAPETKDSDFSWEDFQSRINNDLNNILGNLANRTFVFSKKRFDKIEKPKQISDNSMNIFAKVDGLIAQIEKSYKNYEVRKATKLIFDIARTGNKFFDESKPWVSIKSDIEKAKETIWVCTELLRKISILAYPIIPKSMISLRKMIDLDDNIKWKDLGKQIQSAEIKDIKPLFRKIEDKEVEFQLQKLKENSQTQIKDSLDVKPEIEYEDFTKLDFRVGKVLSAEKVKKSNKLLKLKVKIGHESRTVMSGIAKSYSPEEIVGMDLLLLINLKPRKIMGVLSEAMILAAENNGKLSMLIPDAKVNSGNSVS
ncbi:MAG: methionine--tRNA ligase, partial [Candidatus Cloacimonadota bacterium]|nr:methionine--tRNA ligase [Candidatus Cloacimonadota bacterium]